MIQHSIWLWLFFYGVIVGIPLLLDLFVFHRKDEEDTTKKAIWYSIGWICYALGFGGVIWAYMGTESATQYYTGYIIEKLLSADNLAMFVLIFSAFSVKPAYQHRILFWGILGAFGIRFAFIFGGQALISQFEFLVYIFAFMLISGAWKMATTNEDEQSDEEKKKDLEEKGWFQWLKNNLPLTTTEYGHSFFVKEKQPDGRTKRVFTQLFLVLCCVEIIDVIFAVDSIPAILVISKDPFILIASNVMAILGLRSLYFVLASVLEKFHFLKYGIAAILAIVGLKMLEFGFAPIKYAVEVVEHYAPYFQAHGAILVGILAGAALLFYVVGKLRINGLVKFALQAVFALGGLYLTKYMVGNYFEHLDAWQFTINWGGEVKDLTDIIPVIHVPALVSFSIVIGLLVTSCVASVIFPKKKEEAAEGEHKSVQCGACTRLARPCHCSKDNSASA